MSFFHFVPELNYKSTDCIVYIVHDNMTCWQVRNGFLSVRVWFPAVAGVLTSGDQEVIIMCKPPAPAPPPATPPPASSNTLGEEEGSVRVAGQLDTPSRRLSYEVALYSQLEDGEEEGSSVSGAVEIGADLRTR